MRVSVAFGNDVFAVEENRPELACEVFGQSLLDAEVTQPQSSETWAVEFQHYLEALNEDDVKHLALKIPAKFEALKKRLVKAFGEPIVELETYSFKPKEQEIRRTKEGNADGASVRMFQPDDLTALQKLASGSFRFTRHYRDTFFDKSSADEYYSRLMKTYCIDRASCLVGVAVQNSQIVGFSAARSGVDNEGVRRLNRWLVAATDNREDLYRNLIEGSIELQGSNCDLIEFEVQSDDSVRRATYEFFGAKLTAKSSIFHFTLA